MTSSPRPGNVDGRDFHFISRDDMERAVQDGRFLDYMETRGCLRGVAISSVKDVIDMGKVPVVDLLPQVWCFTLLLVAICLLSRATQFSSQFILNHQPAFMAMHSTFID